MAGNLRAGLMAALLGSAFLGAACSNIETPDLAADVQREKIIPEGWTPMPLSVGVAPMRMALEARPEEFNREDTTRWVLSSSEVDDALYMNTSRDGLNARLISLIGEEYRMFDRVALIDGVTAQTTRDEVLRLALAQRFDVVLEPSIRLNDVSHVDSNGAYGWNMFVWWMVSPVISWWIADEDFEMKLHLDMRMYPVTQNREIASRRLEPQQPLVRSLDDWDQGWHIFSIFSTPGYMDGENWKHIGDKLRPIAENEVKKALLRYLAKDFKAQFEGKRFRDAVRKRVALVVGVDGPNVLPPRYAASDADAVERHLMRAENHPVPAGALRTVVGSRATSEHIFSEAAELAGLARGNDDVFLIFSGAGTVDAQARPALVLTQAGGKASQVVLLEEVVDKLIANKPRSVTMMLDCSFTAPGDRRCVLDEEDLKKLLDTHKGRSLFSAIQDKLETAGIKCVILAAADAVPGNPHGMKALEIDELQKGLFTAFALDAMQGKADSDGNGLVSFVEFESYVKDKVSHVAKLERENQTGYFYISEDFKADFALPTGMRPPK